MESFTEQLRRIDDADLDPYQFRLLMHYWRVGTCWETLRTTAKKCSMSLAKVHGTQKWLLDNGWIEYQPVKMKSGKVKMAIVLCSLHEQTQQLDSSYSEQRSPDEQECSPHEQEPVEDVHDVNAILNEPKEELNEPSEMGKSDRPPVHTSSNAAAFQDLLAELEAALATVCKMNLAYPKHKGKVEPIAVNLAHLGVSPGNIRDGFGVGGWWYLFGHGARDGKQPYLGNVESDIVRVQEWLKAGKPVPTVNGNGRRPPGKDATTELLLARLIAAESEQHG